MQTQPTPTIVVTRETRRTLYDAINERVRDFCGDECGGWCESPADLLDVGDMGHFQPIPRRDQLALLSLLDAVRDDGRDEWIVPGTPILLDLLVAYQDRLKAFIADAAEPVEDHPSAWWHRAGVDPPGPDWRYIDRELEHLHASRLP
jgi:hypothetical protein